MDANGSRYHALVTRGDWTEAAQPDEHWAWRPADPAHPAALGQLVLKPLLFEFKASSAAPLPEPGARAGASFDAYGNLYALDADGRSIRVWSSGSGTITDFWPLPQAPAAEAEAGAFGPCAPAGPATPPRMDALVVTTGHYLVAASREAGGLLIFDLHGGGPPLPQPWPHMPAPEALLALDDGGVALFAAGVLHRLGPDLRPCLPRTASPTAFSPGPAPLPPPAEPPCQLVLGADATAVAALPASRFLVLRVKMDGLYLSVIDWAGTEGVSVGPLEEQIEQATADQEPTLLSTRTLAIEWPADAATEGFDAVVLAASGDQAFRFAASETAPGTWTFELQRDFIPLRRYEAGGLASLARGQVLHRFPSARAFYAGAGRWLPLLTLPRPRCEREGVLVGPVWDSAVPGCVWHRVALDARRPPGGALSLQSRAAETPEGLALQPWRAEPELLPHPAGSELPWRDAAHGSCGEVQTLTCLLQAATGRYLQLRIQASGDGQQSPGLATLRAWYPRFSYLQHYLPAVYRADAAGSAFTERFLALFEGELTRWEDRIAAAQLLLDARTAPQQTLQWLAGWLAMEFDGSTGPARRRALLRHAASVQARRGTVPGLLLAATLAWEPDEVDAEAWLAAPQNLPERLHGLRLQELFGLAPPLSGSAWRPAQGRAVLLAALNGEESLLADAATLQKALGFLPRAAREEAALMASWRLAELPEDEPRPAGGDEALAFDAYLAATQACAPLRQRWQDYLARRWRGIQALNAAWGTGWRGFDRIPSPLYLPAGSAALADWWRFEAQVVRGLGPAHRFRVVLPLPGDTAALDFDELARRRAAVERAVERDKPAHTVAEIRFGFELFRVGEARLGHDTRLEHGLLRRPELAALATLSIWPPLVLGERDLGGGQLTHPRPLPPPDRVGLDR
ncbi:phage tail protein [Pelomonas sp. P7]|uniref:Phage tail protein n=1 Tax=Pelomonas caseinilytica TaxID=2906763 RepID=A0ABS8XD24_9BURK|nr:phage tail protein [Pelomonas sp. P7]MCE4536731.1 phage tail protein [Pelomonas sp. P7]